MASTVYPYEPDYAVSPGEILEERLEVWGMSQAEFARRCGRSPKLINQIIAGQAPVEPDTALQFEKVSGLDARIWLGIEADYQLHRRREAEKQKFAESAEWAMRFPISELVKRGLLKKVASKEDKVANLLAFFGVASVEAWQKRQESMQIAYRHSPSFESNEASLSTWIRLGELEVEHVKCTDYNEPRFKQALTSSPTTLK
jgi:addiction module HigA family antidote